MGAEMHRKSEIARIQIEAAIVHYEADEFVPAITLAGAGEEILGKMVTAAGQENALAGRQAMTGILVATLWPDATSDPKVVQRIANTSRNEMKHEDSGKDVVIEFDAKAEPEDMLDRAIENYFILVKDQTEAMRRYLSKRHAA
jgi:hypothetical protein